MLTSQSGMYVVGYLHEKLGSQGAQLENQESAESCLNFSASKAKLVSQDHASLPVGTQCILAFSILTPTVVGSDAS